MPKAALDPCRSGSARPAHAAIRPDPALRRPIPGAVLSTSISVLPTSSSVAGTLRSGDRPCLDEVPALRKVAQRDGRVASDGVWHRPGLRSHSPSPHSRRSRRGHPGVALQAHRLVAALASCATDHPPPGPQARTAPAPCGSYCRCTDGDVRRVRIPGAVLKPRGAAGSRPDPAARCGSGLDVVAGHPAVGDRQFAGSSALQSE